MLPIAIEQYSPLNPLLKRLIKNYWMIRSDNVTDIQGKLIPMNNIDLIINLSSPVNYISKEKNETIRKSHFTGIQSSYRTVQQKGVLDIIGISFYPTGFYPLIKVPLSEFANEIVTIDSFLKGFEKEIERIAEIKSVAGRLAIIEETLLGFIDLEFMPEMRCESIAKDLLLCGDSVNLKNYSEKQGINQKTLERFFCKYVGTTPKAFLMTNRFQKSIKSLVMGDFDTMTQIGYEFNYYDQTHFINSFKSFMGTTPSKLLKENDLIIDILSNR